jgi:diacylglycerol kinase
MAVFQTSPLSPPEIEESAHRPRRQSWRDKFRVALRGIKYGMRGDSSFAVHFFFTALVLASAIVFHCTLIEWCLLLGCIGLVLVAELFNSAIETLFRCLDEPLRNRAWPCLDIAAGAVLLASITAAVIGSLIFLSKLAVWLNFASLFVTRNS